MREATTNDQPWGPTGSQMGEIAQATYSYEEYPQAMAFLWRQMLRDREPKVWRRIYKSLLLLDHLLKNGSSRVVDSARDHVYDIRALERFTSIDEKGKDQGINGLLECWFIGRSGCGM